MPSKLSCLQLRRLRGGQGRETETGDQETVSPNELSIAFHLVTLEDKTKTCYRDGWGLLKTTLIGA